MRWDRLFSDLEVRFDADRVSDARAEAREHERAREGALTLRDRLVAQRRAVTVATRAGVAIRMGIGVVGADWLAGTATEGRAQVAAPLRAIAWVREDVRTDARSDAPLCRDRVRFVQALRDLARRRATVQLALAHDRPTGTIDRVGADHLEIALHASDQPRRESAVAAHWIIPVESIDHLRWWD